MNMKLIAALLPSAMALLYLLARIFGGQANHMGYSPWVLAIGPVAGALMAALLGLRGWIAWGLLAGVALILVVSVAMAIQMNCLLSYEDWVAKGMPETDSICSLKGSSDTEPSR
jgi:hypothetical protein